MASLQHYNGLSAVRFCPWTKGEFAALESRRRMIILELVEVHVEAATTAA